MRLENIKNELGVSQINYNNTNYNIDESIEQLVRIADQSMTAISDTYNDEVKIALLFSNKQFVLRKFGENLLYLLERIFFK